MSDRHLARFVDAEAKWIADALLRGIKVRVPAKRLRVIR